MKISRQMLLIGVVVLLAVVTVVVVVAKKREGYTRSVYGQGCTYNRTPVDFIMNPKENPHYLADPSYHRQPLERGVDLEFESRYDPDRSNQYRSDFAGHGLSDSMLVNDDKTRFDLVTADGFGPMEGGSKSIFDL